MDDAFSAHVLALKDGGAPGILSEHGLQSAIARPYSGYYSRIHKKCAALLHGIVQNHPFADGNKRTALMLTELLIRRSGYSLVAKPDERIDDLVVAVADGQIEFEALSIWFKFRLVKL